MPATNQNVHLNHHHGAQKSAVCCWLVVLIFAWQTPQAHRWERNQPDTVRPWQDKGAPADFEFSTGRNLPPSVAPMAKKTVNVFVFSRDKRINLASTAIRTSTGFAALFSKKIRVVNVSSVQQLAEKMMALMERHPDWQIGHLWFDSHGKYKTGKALLNIGKDTIHFGNIGDSTIAGPLKLVARYCDSNSMITIGSCYGSAPFERPGNDQLQPSLMHGEELMRGFADIFPTARIYGTDSWIMTGAFMFGRKWALAGYPLENRFRDEIYKPVWEHMGVWRMAVPGTDSIQVVPTAYITQKGDLGFNPKSYLDHPKKTRLMQKKVSKLKPGLYRHQRK